MRSTARTIIMGILSALFIAGIVFLAFNARSNLLGAIKTDKYETNEMTLFSHYELETNGSDSSGNRIKATVNTISTTNQKGMQVSISTDYMHGHSESITLGNSEGMTVTIQDSEGDVKADDFTIEYDTAFLKAEIHEMTADDNRNYIEIRFECETPCETNIVIYPGSAGDTRTSNTENYQIGINKLNAENGRVVYVTPSGKKYHYSEKCAGKNAIITTLYDASRAYEPCSKCAHD